MTHTVPGAWPRVRWAGGLEGAGPPGAPGACSSPSGPDGTPSGGPVLGDVQLPVGDMQHHAGGSGPRAVLQMSAGGVAIQGDRRAPRGIDTPAPGALRRGEVIGLQWKDVDLDRLRLHVRRSVSDVGGIRQERTTKGKRARRVAISSEFAAWLRVWKTASGGERAAGHVWPGQDGGPMSAHSPNHSLTRVLRRAGLVDKCGVPLVRPHGLRHTAASLMLAAGVPLIVVSRQLGHANPNVTAQVYAHLLADSQPDEAAAAFAGLGSS